MIEHEYKAVPVDGPSNLPCACGKAIACNLMKPCTNLLDKTTSALMGTEGFKSMQELEDHFVANGGVIVNIDNLTAYEISVARAAGHLFIDVNGKGFAWQESEQGC